MGNAFIEPPLGVNLPHTQNGAFIAERYQGQEQGMPGSLPVRTSYTPWI